jgi:S1-C subfamily serine protease
MSNEIDTPGPGDPERERQSSPEEAVPEPLFEPTTDPTEPSLVSGWQPYHPAGWTPQGGGSAPGDGGAALQGAGPAEGPPPQAAAPPSWPGAQPPWQPAQSPGWGSWPPPPSSAPPPDRPPEYGAPGGTGGGPPYWSGEPGPTPPDGDRPSRRLGHRLLIGGLVVVVVAAAVATGWYFGRSPRSTKPETASQTIPTSASGPAPGTGAKINVAAIAAKVDPAVVDITSVMPTLGDEAAGTGMILTSDGEVLTNNHVVEEATHITARVDGKGRTYQVRVLGADKTQDVALVQLEGASGLPTVLPGNSATVQVGDSVVAIGNALDLPGAPTVTEGIISALHRSISASDAGSGATENLSGLLQTDAPINPGNSGGPLVNADGQVIGMDTAAANGSSTQSATDVGFAIPIDEALHIARQIQEGRGSSLVTINRGGFVGVVVLSVSTAQQEAALGGLPQPATNSGAYVAQVLQGTPAAHSGLVAGDVITGVDGHSVSDPGELGSLLMRYQPGQSVTVSWVNLAGAKQSVSVRLIPRPVD